MSDIPLYGITCAPADRSVEAEQVLIEAGVDSDKAFLVTTQPNPVPPSDFYGTVILFDSEEINISKWWDLGMEHIRSLNDGTFDVLLIESDARMSSEDVVTVRAAMRDNNCVMAGSDWNNLLGPGVNHIRRDNSRWHTNGRIPGVAYIFAGEVEELRHNPEMRFWYADDWLEWVARVNGGTILVGGTTVEHTGHVTNGGLPEPIATYAREDLVKFVERWGGSPHDGGI